MPLNTLPSSKGYRMPAEWEPHSATLLTWPHNRETWPGSRLERAEKVYTNIISVLHQFEPVILLAANADVAGRVRKSLSGKIKKKENLLILEQPVNDVWARDYGPIMVKNPGGEAAAINWGYNAWGEKYPPWDDDNAIPQFLASRFNLPIYEPGMILEGGSIETNGDGLFLTTESVLLNPNRNPALDKKQIEQKLAEYLGAEKVIWLKDGLLGDDTDGHIDDLSRFTDPDTVVTMLPDDKKDVNYDALMLNYEILSSAEKQDGSPLKIITLPMPETRTVEAAVDGSEYLPASYANFYIANGVVLLPLFDERYDAMVQALFRALFPGRKIAGIPCTDLVWGQGSIHCITQQLYGITSGQLTG